MKTSAQQGRAFVWCALGFAAFWIAVAVEGLQRGAPRGSAGFNRLVLAPLFDAGGRWAVAALWLGLALCCVAAARFVWRHTPKRPGDRWWRWP